MIIDTHAHLNDAKFSEDLDEVRARARTAGVQAAIIVGIDLASSQAATQLAAQWGDAASAGVHPHDAITYTPEAERILRQMLSSSEIVAVGEIGLDYHYDHSPRDLQPSVFRSQIRMAKDAGLPLIMHCREAYADLIRILEEENAREVGGVAHCFFGSDEDARKLLDLGFYLGVGGGVTLPKSEELRQTLRQLPLERVLLETDCPYMAPVPVRGKRNEPAYLSHVVKRLSDLLELPEADIEAATTDNALRCFPRLKTQWSAANLPQ